MGTLKWIVLDIWNSSVTESWDYMLSSPFLRQATCYVAEDDPQILTCLLLSSRH